MGTSGGRISEDVTPPVINASRLLYLDPHVVQPALSAQDPDVPSCHFKGCAPPSMPLLDLDPSLALGFLCASASDFDDLCASYTALSTSCLCPFSIATRPPTFAHPVGDGTSDDDDDDAVLL